MRVRLKNPKGFFDEILKGRGIKLSNFSRISNLNYSILKQCRRGEKTIPLYMFDKLLRYSAKKEFWKNKATFLNDNWGNVMGGLASAKMTNVNKRLEHARRFRKINEINVRLNEIFCEFYGMLLGDGCITRYRDNRGFEKMAVVISCNKLLDSDYLKNWKKILENEYKQYSYYYESKKQNVCTLTIRNKEFCLYLNKVLSVPIGLKYDKINISDKIIKLPWNKKKFVLRGLLDTDGIIFARKDEDYKYPHVSITSKSLNFLTQIRDMLRKRGYPAYINGVDVRIKGIENTKKWFEDIGSSNPRNIKKYRYFLKNKYLPPQSWGLW